MWIKIKLKHIIVFFLIFCIFEVLSTDQLTEKKQGPIVNALQKSHLYQIIVNFLLPYECQLLFKPLCKIFCDKVNEDAILRTKFHTFMFEQIMKSPAAKETSGDCHENFTMVTNFIRFFTEEFCPDIESSHDSEVLKTFKYSKHENQLTFKINKMRWLHYSFTTQKFWTLMYFFQFQSLKAKYVRMPRFPVCFLITDQESNFYLLRMSDVAGTENILKKCRKLKLEMRLDKANSIKTYEDVMLQGVSIPKEEFVIIEFDRITREFQLQDNSKYSPVQMLYWEGNVNHIGRSKLSSFITTKNPMVVFLYSKITLFIVAGIVYVCLYQFLLNHAKY